MIFLIIVSSILCFVRSIPAEDIYGIDFNMVRILDHIGQNLLFRTVNPNNGSNFLFEELIKNMKKRALVDNFTWHDDCKIHLYSFLLNGSKVRGNNI